MEHSVTHRGWGRADQGWPPSFWSGSFLAGSFLPGGAIPGDGFAAFALPVAPAGTVLDATRPRRVISGGTGSGSSGSGSTGSGSTGSGSGGATTAAALVVPNAPTGFSETQLDAASYVSGAASYGSDIAAAWAYATGAGVKVALIDDGFDSSTTANYGNFDTLQSRNFGTGGITLLAEPAGGFHGTTTSGLIGAKGSASMPVGVAVNATIIGVKVTFGTTPLSEFVNALTYAASVGSVISNSWGFTGFGVGEPSAGAYATWYAAVDAAANSGRNGLGDVIVMAAGNARGNAADVGLQPTGEDPHMIAVAASDANGTVAYYSTGGAGLLVSAIGDNVDVPMPGGTSYGVESGTSYSTPTISGIVAMMLSVNANLGWRDVQEILADSAYAPVPSAAGFATNGAVGWNGGGMQFSNDLGFGVVDAVVAVNLARAWTETSDSANLVTATTTSHSAISVPENGSGSGTLSFASNLRIQHVQVTITDTNLPAIATELVLISPDGTRSVLLDRPGLVGTTDETNGLDLSGSTITSNAFWGENAVGTWTLEALDTNATVVGTISSWSLEVWGDNAATVATPLVYTPEFATLAAAHAARTIVTTAGTHATTIDLIGLTGTTDVNLNGGAGTIDGVAVTIDTGLKNANAEGSTGNVTLVGLSAGGSTLTGGDGTTSITGYGKDSIASGLGATTIHTGAGGSHVTLSTAAAATTAVSVASGGGDTIWAGSAKVTITDTGKADSVFAQSSTLTFINGSYASTVAKGSGTVTISAGSGGGTYYAGSGGGSTLSAGTGRVIFYGEANGDTLTAGGSAADELIAGAGTETLDAGTATGTLTFVGGSGIAFITAGVGKANILAGSGNDTINIGTGADTITFTDAKNGGLYTLNGFRLGTDLLKLSGYASGAAASAVAGASSDGFGGTLMTLADGSRIDLSGVTHVTTAAFG